MIERRNRNQISAISHTPYQTIGNSKRLNASSALVHVSFLSLSLMKQSLAALLTIGSVLMSSTAFAAPDEAFSTKPFTDVPKTSASYEGIEYLRTQNVLKGYTDGTFKPATRINRAEFAQLATDPFIIDTNGKAECISANFEDDEREVFFFDVDREAWYASNVCFAKTRNIISGYPDGTFKPGDPINFVEAAKILANVFSFELEVEDQGEFWYRPYVQRLSELNAIPTTIKGFDQTITRAEMAEMLFRLKTNRRDKAHTTMSAIR